MEHRLLGKTGMRASVLGFGGSEIGFQGATDKTVAELLNAALDAGLNVIDTAECYMNSEALIGAAVSHRRRDYLLFTKVGHEHGLGQGSDWSAASIARTIDRSLKHLRTDHVDLVQLHSCDADVLKKGEALAALQAAKAAGKTRFIGYSGDNEPALLAVQSGKFDTLQTSVNVADQWSIDHTLPLAIEKGMGVIAKRPIANAAWRFEHEPVGEYAHEYWKRLRTLAYPFLKDGHRAGPEAGHTAMRFTLGLTDATGRPLVHTAIVGTQNPARWKQNAQGLAQGMLDGPTISAIRARWREAGGAAWDGQV